MSYEGYCQFLCSNGHLWEEGENYGSKDYGPCPDCGAGIVFQNSVDQTNCDEVGIIIQKEWNKLEISEEVNKKCDLGHIHRIEPARYRVPSKDELNTIRYYWDSTCESFIKLKPR